MSNKAFYNLKAGQGKTQIICFPYLGGHAFSFRDVGNKLEGDSQLWAANPPGHIGATGEVIKDIDGMVEYYITELQNIVKDNYILFGHSMGGVVAYFLAQRILRFQNISPPKAMVISASSVPLYFKDKKYADMLDKDLNETIISYGAMPKEIMSNEDFMRYLLPIFRADFQVLESSAVHSYVPLDIPVYLLYGESDPIGTASAMRRWTDYFQNMIQLIPINKANHMFIHDKASEVAKILKQILTNYEPENINLSV